MNGSDPGAIIIEAIYYILTLFVVFFSAFGVYIVIRYGKSRGFALVLSLTYIFFFLAALSQSYNTLQALLS